MLVDPTTIPALLKKHHSLRKAAIAIGVSNGAMQKSYRAAVAQGIMQHVAMGPKKNQDQKPERVGTLKTKKKKANCFIVTSAQNNTLVHDALWENLQALAKKKKAEIFVSTMLYGNRSHWQANLDKRRVDVKGKRKEKGERDEAEIWYDPRVMPYINNERTEIANGLVWCGESNVSPSASTPLSGLKVYTGRDSMIVPHTRQELESIAALGGSGTKFNYTTGTVTHRNYIQRKAGLIAEFYHTYGALIVEIDKDGYWWVRQLNATDDGTIYDLDWKVQDGEITTGNRVEAITFGDIHLDEIDPVAEKSTWGKGGMVDVLKPRFQFFHDILNFSRRSHHNIKDPHKMLGFHIRNKESVEQETQQIIDWLRTTAFREDCQSVIVPSNHDEHIYTWLSKNDGRFDPVNARFWARVTHQLIEYQYAHDGDLPPSVLAFIIEQMDLDLNDAANVVWLDRDTSFVICPDHGGGIECALHFDQGANGSRGSLASFATMGRRSNGGHSHSAGSKGGAMQAGHKSKPFLGYNHGLSSWSQSDIIVHENAKRQIVTFYGPEKKWRA